MPIFKKSVLQAGRTYHSPDGKVRVTKKRLAHWAAEHQRLMNNGQTVPIDWDHADDPTKAVPMAASEFNKKRRSAKNTVGHLTGFKLTDDGRSAELIMNLHRRSAVEAAEANSVFVSPVIFESWKDGGNNEYSDLVTHVDFVNHPVDWSQGRFEVCPEGAVACGIRMGLQGGTASTYFMLAIDDDEEEEDEEDEEEILATLGDDYDEGMSDAADPADDVDVDVDVTVDDDDDGDEMGMEYDEDDDDDFIEEDEEDITMLDYDAGGEESSDGTADFGTKILSDLEGAGIAAPEGVDPLTDTEGFLAQLCAALKQKKMSESDAGLEMGGDDYDEFEDEDDFLSDEETETMTPDIAALSLRADTAEKRLKRVQAHIEKDQRKSLVRRLGLALRKGQITPVEHRKIAKACKTIRLSLEEDGTPKRTVVSEFLASRECLPAGCALPHTDRMSMVEGKVQSPSYEQNGHMTAKEATAIVDKMAKEMPGMYRKRA